MAPVAVVLAMMMAGCAAEQIKAEKEERISAARLSGKFQHDDPLVKMLSPEERGALDRAGMLAPRPEGEELAGDPDSMDEAATFDDEEKSTSEKAGDVLMSVLSVSVTLGMMAAPYLLF
jgi:hypothetical protein